MGRTLTRYAAEYSTGVQIEHTGLQSPQLSAARRKLGSSCECNKTAKMNEEN
jgi:hypothetical protein